MQFKVRPFIAFASGVCTTGLPYCAPPHSSYSKTSAYAGTPLPMLPQVRAFPSCIVLLALAKLDLAKILLHNGLGLQLVSCSSPAFMNRTDAFFFSRRGWLHLLLARYVSFLSDMHLLTVTYRVGWATSSCL